MEPLHDLLARATTRPDREPVWDASRSPGDPWPLLEEWLRAAIDDGLPGAATVVVATADVDGVPAARTVLLQDVTEEGFRFALGGDSPAGRQLAANPAAALVLHLREHARQIRVAGAVMPSGEDRSAAAFLARGAHSRAATIAGDQSAPLPADADERIAAALPAQRSDDPPVDPRWTAYLVAPREIEFWQSRRDTGEQRLAYLRDGDGWRLERRWP